MKTGTGVLTLSLVFSYWCPLLDLFQNILDIEGTLCVKNKICRRSDQDFRNARALRKAKQDHGRQCVCA